MHTGAAHAVATRLVAGFCDVTSTCFVAPFTQVLSSHCPGKICDQVIMSFDIIQYIKAFWGVYLPFKHDVFAVQTMVDNYIIVPKD